jgi:hypothetical protein
MHPLSYTSANWQKWLPALAVIGAILWLILFRSDPTSERALFAALLVIYMLHQTEEHLWPGGFRQFANAHVFKSGNDDWPVDEGGVALVNIGYVWLPVGLAALFPGPLRWIGLGWVGLTLINAITHIVTSIRFRVYNPGLVTSIVLFLPFTIWMLAREVSAGTLSGLQVVLILVLGVVLHIPVAALFVVPFRRARDKKRSAQSA